MNFLKTLMAVLVGLILYTGIMFFVLLGFISIATKEEEVKVKENSVLKLNLNRPILERAIDDPFGIPFFSIPIESTSGLVELKRAISNAKDDPRIKGIYLEAPFVITGFGKLEELRKAIEDFKTSGKFVIAYSDFYTEGGYYISTIADEIYVNPIGIFEFNGLSAEITFYKEMLAKLEVDPVIFRVGDYKSAVEPFLRSNMSEENREQYKSFINSIYAEIINKMAESRRISPQVLRQMSDDLEIRLVLNAKERGLVDDLIYQDQVFDIIRDKIGITDDKEINFISANRYHKSIKSKYSQNKIAVIVASGEIVMGRGEQDMVGAEVFVKEIRQAKDNNRIKAIVLRINSPGGNYIASDILWREIKQAAKIKPVIASLSDYAASGGYYLAMACDTIVSDYSTITGSIGVFRIQFTIQDFLKNKLGITSDRVNTGNYSDMNSVLRPMTDAERQIIQNEVDEVYEVFVSKAAEGRGLSEDSIRKIAGGRVWTGAQALENGLVDLLGNFEDAVKLAAQIAGVENDYSIVYYPEQKSLLEEILYEMGNEAEVKFLKQEMGILYPYVEQLKKLEYLQGIQARMPAELTIY
jgi:protease-4